MPDLLPLLGDGDLGLYVSNRGNDSIAAYRIDPAKGTLTSLEFIPSLGKAPRNMSFDPTGQYLFVTNQNSDNLVIFKFDAKTGHLTPTGQRMEVPQAGGVSILRQ